MEEERNTGVTIKELRQFLSKLPPEFDSFGMVNGEVAALGDSFYVRIDKPIVHLEIDESNKEFLILHQTETEISEIENTINGNPEGN